MADRATIEMLLEDMRVSIQKQSQLIDQATKMAMLLLPQWLPTNDAAEALNRPSRSLTNLARRGALKYGVHWRRGVRGRSYEFEVNAMNDYFDIPPELKREHLQPR